MIDEEKLAAFIDGSASDKETEEVLEEILIKQNEDGIDIEDRINTLKEYIRKYPNMY